MSNNNSVIWREAGDVFTPGSNAAQRNTLPPGIYQYNQPPMGPWFLSQTAKSYQFPYKIYGNHDPILQRVQKAWANLPANLGVLLNGIKGTGKTVTAQLIANWAISENLPVLVVHNPVPLSGILEALNQDVMVIFDEFEKTHKNRDDQEALLTALDGMSRSSFKRLYVFTTNDTKVDTNFIDRPSRIRYLWEFKRLEDSVLEELVDDLLDESLRNLRGNILKYLKRRAVLSIDVVKATVQEVNIFKEAPEAFETMMNLSKKDIQGYRLTEILPSGKKEVFLRFFDPSDNELLDRLSVEGREEFIQMRDENDYFNDPFAGRGIILKAPTTDPNTWVCTLKVRRSKTWQGAAMEDAYSRWVNLDHKPEGWEEPEGTSRWLDRRENQKTCYGTDNLVEKVLHIEPLYERVYDFKAF